MSLSFPLAEGERRPGTFPRNWEWPWPPFALCAAHASQGLLGRGLWEAAAGVLLWVLASAEGPPGHTESLILAGSGQKMPVAAPNVAASNVAPNISFGYFRCVRRKTPLVFRPTVSVADSWDTV